MIQEGEGLGCLICTTKFCGIAVADRFLISYQLLLILWISVSYLEHFIATCHVLMLHLACSYYLLFSRHACSILLAVYFFVLFKLQLVHYLSVILFYNL